ncbi:uncharacterized protein LOC142334843 [Convolutriloba macropyga]|uniref:uncharacterized protein LOC142334843 n=1 Tax=Convolutriloba macropyga TaxID=536237 RepID=UPI003F5219D1
MIATANLISVVGATDTEERERVYSFDNYYISTQLSGYTIESIVANTRLACAIACSINEDCVSFNYCEGKLCELNEATINDNFITAGMQPNHECSYYGLPDRCESPDTSLEICSNCSSKFDRYSWSNWSISTFLSLDQITEHDFIIDQRRKCLDGSGSLVSDVYCQGS